MYVYNVDITSKLLERIKMSNNFEITYHSDCCGAYVHSDADLCPTCLEHCEVIEERVDFECSEAVHFESSLDFYGAG